MSKIKPQPYEVQLEIDEAKAGALNMESIVSAVEIGKVIAIGDKVEGVKVGQKVLFKSWAVDICTIEGKIYYFLNMTTNGIKATIS